MHVTLMTCFNITKSEKQKLLIGELSKLSKCRCCAIDDDIPEDVQSNKHTEENRDKDKLLKLS